MKILVVEDERIIAINLKESLESLGYKVPAIAASGEKAIDKATEFHPDLVLMDIWLKGNIDGIEAAQQIWERLKIPTIYVTGHSDQSTVERAKITAPFGYILKPVKEQALYVAIETALQRYEREQLLSAILKGIGDGVIVTDKDCRVQFLNHKAESLTGWQLADARDRELTEVFNIIDEQTQQPVGDVITGVLEKDTIIYLEERILLIPKQGKAIPIADSIAPIKNNDGAIAGAVLVFRDATQQRLAQEQNQAMERARQLEYDLVELQCLDQFQNDGLGTISGELLTPLSTIKLAVRMLETILDQQSLLSSQIRADSTTMARYGAILQQQCNPKLKLVNDLLDMQRIDAQAYPLELTSIRFPDWIYEHVAPFQAWATFQQQRFSVDIAPDLPPLVSELSSLTRILTELLNNAFNYTPAGEEIAVTVRGECRDAPWRVWEAGDVGAGFTDNLWRQTDNLTKPALLESDRGIASTLNSHHFTFAIQVSNSGVEIPLEERAKIFDPFYRIPNPYPWKPGGTGLGLTVVKKLVHRLQGEIEVTSDRDGTRFTIFVPTLQSQGMEVDHDHDQ
ncbi:response regulator [Coleofasciculus sp. G2-EDA-02]|uniref:response regulator n=1 Tax=Coleofasciculus sp. G2-EDA-02 TaxID=3069529 RepID=UPI0032FB71B7